MLPSLKRLLLCIAIIAGATIYMASSTWLTWPDTIYDFGSQLYYPWQMIHGRHLYTGIAYFNGPLSQYFNAGMFSLLGSSVHTLMLVNGAILLAVIAMIFRLVCRLSDSFTATVACVVFVTDFAFSRYIGIGNYNWICPYTHEVTHGVAMSLGMVLALESFLRTERARWLVLGSVLFGLIFLTKAEVFGPAAAVFTLALVLRMRTKPALRYSEEADRPPVNRPLRSTSEPAWSRLNHLLAACLTFTAVLITAYALIALQAGTTAAKRALLGTWPWVFDHRISQLQFYRHGLGTDDLQANLWRMLVIAAASLALLAGAIGVGISPRRWRMIAILVFFTELAVVIWYWPWTLQVARPWPVFVATIAGVSTWQAWRANLKAALRAMLAVLALGLLGKMLFNARPAQYGFALAMPASIVLVETIVGWLPAVLARRGIEPSRMRRAGAALVSVIALGLHANQIPASASRISLASGADRFRGGVSGEEVNRACRTIDTLLPKDGTLAVMPQGLMLNFLTRRADSIVVVNMMPPEVMSAGEDNIVEQLDGNPPDLIVLSETDIGGGAFVLRDGDYHYGRKIAAWVMLHYRCRIPADPGSQLRLSFWVPTS